MTLHAHTWRWLAPCLAGISVALACGPPAAHAKLDRIVFTGGHGLYTIRSDGSARRHLISGDVSEPAWSPSGGRIAFARSLGGEYGQRQIWTMRADGTHRRALTARPPEHVAEETPVWSPDGRRVAFIRKFLSESHPVTSLVTIGADGLGERTLVTFAGQQSHFPARPSWSPDGTRLLYTRFRRKGVHVIPSLWIVGAGGLGDRMLADRTEAGSWSPQGARIAAVSVRNENGEICGEGECYWTGEIYVMNADGSIRRRLTRNRGDDSSPAWSPDGKRIAFASSADGFGSEIYSIRPSGRCRTWLTNRSSPSEQPAWEPRSGLSSTPARCGAAGRRPVVDTRVPKPHLPGGATSWWLGRIAPGGLLLTSVFRGDDYTYGDCGNFNPRTCPEGVDVFDSWVCSRFADDLAFLQPSQVNVVRGALFLWGYPEDVESLLFTGTTQVELDTSARRARQVVDQLRPANSEQPMAGNLPPPALPDRTWRKLDPAVADKLRALGITGRTTCPRRK